MVAVQLMVDFNLCLSETVPREFLNPLPIPSCVGRHGEGHRFLRGTSRRRASYLSVLAPKPEAMS
jgi:hypothetical protein